MINSKNSETASSSTSLSFNEGTSEFTPIDADIVKRDLGLTKKAKRNALRGIPREDSEEKDTLAQDIDIFLIDSISAAKSKYDNRIRAIDALTSQQSITYGQDVAEIFQNGRRNLQVVDANHYGNLIETQGQFILSVEELTEFRRVHRRIGPASYLSGIKKYTVYALLVFYILIEGIISGWTIGSVYPGGVFGIGFIVSAFSLLSVGISFIVGLYCIPLIIQRFVFRKILGFILSIGLILGIGCSILALAHFRDAIVFSDSDDYLDIARNNLFSTPFTLDDIKSYLLLGGGLFGSFLSIVKGFILDDPYFGYGKVQRKQENLNKKFNSMRADALINTTEIVEYHSRRMLETIDTMAAHRVAIEQRRNDKETLYNKYTTWASNIPEVGKKLYSHYREENLKHRKSSTDPKTFTLHQYQPPQNMIFDPPPPIAISETFLQEENKIKETYEKNLGILSSELEELHKKYRSIEELDDEDVLRIHYDINNHE